LGRFQDGSGAIFNFAANPLRDAALKRHDSGGRTMVREKTDNPRALTAPLSQSQLASLRGVADGTLAEVPPDHRLRLLDLEVVKETQEGLVVTDLGRRRLIADR